MNITVDSEELKRVMTQISKTSMVTPEDVYLDVGESGDIRASSIGRTKKEVGGVCSVFGTYMDATIIEPGEVTLEFNILLAASINFSGDISIRTTEKRLYLTGASGLKLSSALPQIRPSYRKVAEMLDVDPLGEYDIDTGCFSSFSRMTATVGNDRTVVVFTPRVAALYVNTQREQDEQGHTEMVIGEVRAGDIPIKALLSQVKSAISASKDGWIRLQPVNLSGHTHMLFSPTDGQWKLLVLGVA